MSRLGEGEQESKGDFWTGRRRRQQLGTHSKVAFQQVHTVELAYSGRQIFGHDFQGGRTTVCTEIEEKKSEFAGTIFKEAVQ